MAPLLCSQISRPMGSPKPCVLDPMPNPSMQGQAGGAMQPRGQFQCRGLGRGSTTPLGDNFALWGSATPPENKSWPTRGMRKQYWTPEAQSSPQKCLKPFVWFMGPKGGASLVQIMATSQSGSALCCLYRATLLLCIITHLLAVMQDPYGH